MSGLPEFSQTLFHAFDSSKTITDSTIKMRGDLVYVWKYFCLEAVWNWQVTPNTNLNLFQPPPPHSLCPHSPEYFSCLIHSTFLSRSMFQLVTTWHTHIWEVQLDVSVLIWLASCEGKTTGSLSGYFQTVQFLYISATHCDRARGNNTLTWSLVKTLSVTAQSWTLGMTKVPV